MYDGNEQESERILFFIIILKSNTPCVQYLPEKLSDSLFLQSFIRTVRMNGVVRWELTFRFNSMIPCAIFLIQTFIFRFVKCTQTIRIITICAIQTISNKLVASMISVHNIFNSHISTFYGGFASNVILLILIFNEMFPRKRVPRMVSFSLQMMLII